MSYKPPISILAIFTLIALVGSTVYFNRAHPKISEPVVPPAQSSTSKTKFIEPTDHYLSRVTKKPFGIYITPKDSPIQPEKFTGYHTGADAEYGDIADDVEVHAIADGKVVISRTATGYGGVIVIDHRPTSNFFSLYGHVDPASLVPLGTEVKQGDVIAKLAPPYSAASGGERKHLHLAIINQATPVILGYVQTKAALSGWLDPVALLTGQ